MTTDLLRGRLGFTGTVVTDALEMRAVSATIGMTAGFVQALAAGADAIETGALEYPHLVDDIPAAVLRALDDGTLPLERVRDAAARTARLAGPPGDPRPVTATGGTAMARGCLEVVGTLPALVDPLVVVARPPGGSAVGELPWALDLTAAVRTVDVTDAGGVAALDPRGRPVVAVVRDPQLHPWQAGLLERATVVVDVGWPAVLPPGTPAIRTRGVAPALLAAAADLLAAAPAPT